MPLTRDITYQAARAVAEQLETHFAQHIEQARQQDSQDLATEPDAQVIEAILDTAFWASLRHEEGHATRVSLAYLPPEQTKQPLLFEKPLPFTANILTKIAPGVERPGIHLGVWGDGDELYVWGTTRNIPSLCFVVDVSEPGLLVIKHRRLEGFGKFANVAVLKGDRVKVVDEGHSNVPDCPEFLTSLLGFTSPSAMNDSANVLIQLAVSMREHRRGGTLLVVPSTSTTWRESIMQPILYAVNPAFGGLAELMRQDEEKKSRNVWQTALRREVDSIAGLTAIDGATIINDDYDLLAFGTKIGRPVGNAPVEQVLLTEPIIGTEATIVRPSHLGGTRHLSAAQFVQDQHDTLALVASQDGRFTIFTWSKCEQIVQAHQIDALLL
ncbi:putative sensor domain DACNV-containing protein [Pontibacter korlensis]|uniref:Probable sensor domain-containing protein n=1 Tax=Pontibacter korlensis TaxID=400092 RepID=A0A0E3UZ34_9BACT|nr:hypothetical protein [Pontibacter korlensis]AKD04986.1 hypothetical protein PKOR_20200 [Pontibacter korlensis]